MFGFHLVVLACLHTSFLLPSNGSFWYYKVLLEIRISGNYHLAEKRRETAYAPDASVAQGPFIGRTVILLWHRSSEASLLVQGHKQNNLEQTSFQLLWLIICFKCFLLYEEMTALIVAQGKGSWGVSCPGAYWALSVRQKTSYFFMDAWLQHPVSVTTINHLTNPTNASPLIRMLFWSRFLIWLLFNAVSLQ